jgi:protein-ribulosamine 3-kinase
MLPPAIIASCQEIIKGNITLARPVAGGDINRAYHVETPECSYFIKTNTASWAGQMFEAEAKGLRALDSPCILRTPAVLGFGSTSDGSYLLLEFIETSYRPDVFWEKFGTALAKLHRSTAPGFGFDHDNFIGSLPQRNHHHDDWPTFYTEERLLPQLKITKQQNLLQTRDFQQFDLLFKKLPDLCPKEPPALTHGDLWSGNFLCDAQGQPVLIDPAASYSHREMDLAMSRLFGGFERPFYRSYEEEWPLEPGFEHRLPIYQLYFLLVHVNLFGGGYVRSVREVLAGYV